MQVRSLWIHWVWICLGRSVWGEVVKADILLLDGLEQCFRPKFWLHHSIWKWRSVIAWVFSRQDGCDSTCVSLSGMPQKFWQFIHMFSTLDYLLTQVHTTSPHFRKHLTCGEQMSRWMDNFRQDIWSPSIVIYLLNTSLTTWFAWNVVAWFEMSLVSFKTCKFC